MDSFKKKKGLLITNGFLRTDKFAEHYEWLKEAGGSYNIQLEMMGNDEILFLCGEDLSWLDKYSFLLFWDKDIRLGKQIRQYAIKKQIPIYNSIESIEICDDKFETYHRILEWNQEQKEDFVSLLPTIMAPMTYENIGYTNLDFLLKVEAKLSYPIVVKECFGSFGAQVYLAQDHRGLCELTKKLAGVPFLYQKFHEYSQGRDIRLQVVGDQVVAGMYRFSENGDFRANITNGGQMKAYEPSEREVRLAVKVAKILGLDFAGIDLLFSETGADILCEVNSNAHFKNIHTCTGVNVADHIMKYIAGKISNLN